MSEEYYDSKGVRHYSSLSRDDANDKYLREERYAREQQVALQAVQVKLQAEQVKLARQQINAQDAHNAKIEAIAKREAAAAESKREFENDIQWLERSNSEERFDYLVSKAKSGLIQHLKDCLIETASIRIRPISSNITSNLRSSFADLCERNEMWSIGSTKLQKIEAEINSLLPKTKIGFWQKAAKFGALFFLFEILVFCLAAYPMFSDKVNGVVDSLLFAGTMSVIPGGIAWWLWRQYSRAASRAKASSKRLDELAVVKSQVYNSKTDLETEINKHRSKAIAAYQEWVADSKEFVTISAQKSISENSFSGEVKTYIEKYEKKYPPNIRVNWADVKTSSIHEVTQRLSAEIIESAIRLVCFDLLSQQFAANNEKGLSNLVSKTRDLLIHHLPDDDSIVEDDLADEVDD